MAKKNQQPTVTLRDVLDALFNYNGVAVPHLRKIDVLVGGEAARRIRVYGTNGRTVISIDSE